MLLSIELNMLDYIIEMVKKNLNNLNISLLIT